MIYEFEYVSKVYILAEKGKCHLVGEAIKQKKRISYGILPKKTKIVLEIAWLLEQLGSMPIAPACTFLNEHHPTVWSKGGCPQPCHTITVALVKIWYKTTFRFTKTYQTKKTRPILALGCQRTDLGAISTNVLPHVLKIRKNLKFCVWHKKLNIDFSLYSPKNLGGQAFFPSHKIQGILTK